MAVSSAAASLYDASRLFNHPPPPGTKNSTERGQRYENPLAKPLWLLESTTSSATILLADKATLPPFSRYHTERLRERVLALKHLKCLYSDLREFKGFWFVANSDRFGTIPPQPWCSPGTSTSPKFSEPQWLDNKAPWMGFSSTYGANEGKVLSCIRIPNCSLPSVVERTAEGLYRLNPALREEWSDLEDKLARLGPILWGPLTHLPCLERPTRPQHFGYLEEYDSEALAQDKIRRSRNAFSRMVTFTSFLLSFWRFSDLEYPFANLNQFLRYEDVGLAYFVRELTSTTSVGDFRLGTRTGYIIDLFNYPGDWLPFMHIWVEAGVPLWIYAGPDPLEDAKTCKAANPAILNAIRDWLPGQMHITAAFAEYCAQVLCQPLPPNSLRRVTVGDSEGFIPELASLGFCCGDYEPGMPPSKYFSTKKAALDRWKATLGDSAVIRDQIAGWLMSGSRIWKVQRSHHPRQRYWCPLRTTVELCWWLYPEGGAANLAVAGEMDDLEGPADPQPPPPPMASSAPLPPSTSLSPNLRAAPSFSPGNYSESDEEDDSGDGSSSPAPPPAPSASAAVVFDPLKLRTWQSCLLDRLGYDASRPLLDTDGAPSFPPKTLNPDYWKTAIRCLGLRFPSGEDYSENDKATIVDAVGVLSAHENEDSFVFGNRWDIATSRSPLRICPSNLDCHRIVYSSKSGPLRHRFVIATKDRHLRDQWWVLVVSPMAMIQICRTGINTMLAMGRHLIQCGIPFNTALAISLPQLPSPRRIVRQLDQLPPDSIYDPAMYSIYKSQCDAFLSTQRGALALKCGGILWRLAIEQVDRTRVKNALFAPSHSAQLHGTWLGELNGIDFVDDCLEGNELDILLGAYRCQKEKEEVVVFLWPTEYAWATSGMNIGEWSDECEGWFQRRLSEIRGGTAKLFTSTHWSSQIRLLRESYKVWATYNSAVNSTYSHSSSQSTS